MARQVVEGDASKQYTMLWSYSEELRRVCGGNTCKIQLDRPGPDLPPRFGAFYMCLDGCKKAFIAACRPFIGVDGCHLKTGYGGQLLIAVGRDPNDQYFLLAFAVVETETKESWRWFLTLLLEDIGDITTNRWVFISDQQKGLIPVFEMLHGVEHRFCLRHLYCNFKKKFGGGTLIRDLMMGAAKATYYQAWEEKMNQIKAIDVKAWEWLPAIPPKCWCKHAFSFYPECDVLMNNISESFNSAILLARDKPIITMYEWIRSFLMSRFARLNENLARYRGNVMPKPRRRLDRKVEMSGNWLATWAGEQKFEVTHTMGRDRFVVDLTAHSFTCNLWELVGILCRHVIAAITYKGEDPELYVHNYYKRDAYELCYGQPIAPINGENLWPKTNNEDILPPIYKPGPGRPKKLRRREPDENPNPFKLSRSHTKNKCRRCHSYGHNQRKCNPPPPVVEANEENVDDGSQANIVPTDASQPQNSQPNTVPTNASQPQDGNYENQPQKKQRGRPRTRSSNVAGNSTPSEGLSQVVDNSSQEPSQVKKRGRPKGKVAASKLGPTRSVKDKAGPSSSHTKASVTNNMWEQAKKSVEIFHSLNGHGQVTPQQLELALAAITASSQTNSAGKTNEEPAASHINHTEDNSGQGGSHDASQAGF